MIQTNQDFIIIVGGEESAGLDIKPRIDIGFSILLDRAFKLYSWRAAESC